MTVSTTPSAMEAPGQAGSDLAYISLTRLLQRLEANILSERGALILQTSGLERAKATTHIDTARTLLVQVDHDSKRTPKSSLGSFRKSQTTRDADIQAKRLILKQLQDKLFELNHGEEDAPLSRRDDNDDGDDEDILALYVPAHTRNQSTSNLNATKTSVATPPAARATSEVRQRSNATKPPAHGAAAASHEDAQPGRSIGTTLPFAPKPDSLKTHSQLLEAHDTQQDEITSDLLQLASKLKQSTQAFAQSLAESGDVIDRAAHNLDKNVTGMEKASAQMNLLRRATSGWNYFHKLSVYVRIAILWVAIIFLVFVMPKLR